MTQLQLVLLPANTSKLVLWDQIESPPPQAAVAADTDTHLEVCLASSELLRTHPDLADTRFEYCHDHH